MSRKGGFEGDGRDRFGSQVRRIGDRWRQAFLKAVLFLEGEVEDEAPVVTGNLVNSISSYVKQSASRTWGIIHLGAHYAGYVIQGTGIYGPRRQAYTVTARNARALHFTVGGTSLFRRSATIRGQKPNPFQRRAFRRSKQKVMELILRACR